MAEFCLFDCLSERLLLAVGRLCDKSRQRQLWREPTLSLDESAAKKPTLLRRSSTHVFSSVASGSELRSWGQV